MEFEFREYVKSGSLLAVGYKPEYYIRIKTADWLRRGTLLEADLAEIDAAIKALNPTNESSTQPFNVREYIKRGYILAIGCIPDYKIKIATSDLCKEGLLLEEDLAEIEEAINMKNEEVSV